MEMSNKVLEKIAVKYGKVMEGVKSIMGGKVLESVDIIRKWLGPVTA